MANFYAYVALLMGLGLILGLTGISTTSGHLIGKFIDITPASPTSNATVNADNLHNGAGGNTFLISLFAIFATVAAIGLGTAIISGGADTASLVKLLVLIPLLAVVYLDLSSLITYLNGINLMHGLVKMIAYIVYLPLIGAAIISALDWLGGGR